MTFDLNQIDFYKVLFWIIIVLVAGFIGQFGKSFAKYIMDRFGKKSPRPAPGTGQPHQVDSGHRSQTAAPLAASPSSQPALSKEESKIRKKELKAELKSRKKEDK